MIKNTTLKSKLAWPLVCFFTMWLATACGPTKKVTDVSVINRVNSTLGADTNLKHLDSLFYKGVFYNNIENYDSALIVLNKFSRAYPNISATYFQMARAHIGKNSSLSVIGNLITKAYDIDPDNKWYMLYYANLVSLKGNYLQAAKIYTDLIQRGNYEKEYFMQALTNFEKAETYDSMFKVIELMDAHTDVEDELIESLKFYIYQYKNDINEIERIFQEKIEQGTATLDNKINIYKYYRKEKLEEKKNEILKTIDYFGIQDKEEADEFLKLMLLNYEEDYVNNIIMQLYSDSVRMDLERSSDLVRSIVEVWRINPRSIKSYIQTFRELALNNTTNYYPAIFMYDYYRTYGNGDSVKFYSQKSFNQGNMRIDNFNYLAMEDLIKENEESYLKNINVALSRDSNYAVAYYTLFYYYRDKDNTPMAIESLEKCISNLDSTKYSSTFSSNVHMFYGDAIQNLEPVDTQKIIKNYILSLQYNANNISCLNNYAYFLTKINQNLELALMMSSITVNVEPEIASYLDTYGWINYLLGNYVEAQKYLLEAVKFDERSSYVILDHLGDVEAKLGNIESAISYYKKALEATDVENNQEEIRTKIKKYE